MKDKGVSPKIGAASYYLFGNSLMGTFTLHREFKDKDGQGWKVPERSGSETVWWQGTRGCGRGELRKSYSC